MPSSLAIALCTAVPCFLDRRFELFIESSRSKQWIGYGFTVVRPHMYTTQQPQDDEVGLRSSRVNVGCLLSLPSLLLHLTSEPVFFYVVMQLYLSKWVVLYFEDVKIFTIKLWESTEVTLAWWFSHLTYVCRVRIWLHLVVEACSKPLKKVIQCQITSPHPPPPTLTTIFKFLFS